MGEATEDRRVRRTKSRLKTAILELVREKSYGRITIREITDRADVGRSTFYSHFDSKEDLLFSGFDDWLLSLASSADGPAEGPEEEPEGFRFSLPLLRHARSQRRFVEAVVVGAGSAGVRRRLTASSPRSPVGSCSDAAGASATTTGPPTPGPTPWRGRSWACSAGGWRADSRPARG